MTEGHRLAARASVWIALVGGPLVLAPRASAHRLGRPKSDQLLIQPHRLLLRLWFGYSPGKMARDLRSIFDRDRDAVLSGAEQGRLRRYLARMASHRLQVRVNGNRVRWTRIGTIAVGVEGPSRSADALSSLSLFEAPISWRIGANEIEMSDRHPNRSVRVPTRAHLAPPLAFRWTSQGRYHSPSRQIVDVRLGPAVKWRVSLEAPARIR